MRSFFILALLSLVGLCLAQNCPSKYKRFSPKHSFCLAPNPQCQVKRAGVSKQDIDLILRLHNQFRSKVAMGKENGAKDGRLPKAADMMQMEWDDELAAVAQKWASNCNWGHDCRECRAVENFDVGQNIAAEDWDFCSNCPEPSSEPDWTGRINGLYGEVKDYRTSWLDSYTDHPGPMTGHFTQVVWSKTWRVGCGYAFYKKGGSFHKYYVCNYAPGGNFETQPVYKRGQPCSACPTNTKCSTGGTFPGLCKLDNPNTAPAEPRNPNEIFYCADTRSDKDCKSKISGDGSWKTVRSPGGDYNSIVLNGGQSTTVTYSNPIVPKSGTFCLALDFRKGPLDASVPDRSSLKANYKMGRASASPMELNTGRRNFMDYKITLSWGYSTTFSLTFSVPKGAGQHVLDIRRVMAYDGRC